MLHKRLSFLRVQDLKDVSIGKITKMFSHDVFSLIQGVLVTAILTVSHKKLKNYPSHDWDHPID